MAGETTVTKVKLLWSLWDIRVLILLSLVIQVLLTFLAPLRKRCASGALKLVLWLLYLSASAVALYIISQIAGHPNNDQDKIDLLAFWSPFLLLHLGGPDTITALALEDNELWLRHCLELVTQLGVTSYVFANSVRRHSSWLWFPTMFMFVDGFIKYMERSQALYKASIDSFRDSLDTDPEPGPNYARLMDVYYSSQTAHIPTAIQGRDQDDLSFEDFRMQASHDDEEAAGVKEGVAFQRKDTDKLVIEAYWFYDKFKALLADNFLSLKDRKECREIFMKKRGNEAFRIIEIELNLIYDVFYTKAFLIESKQAYLRAVSYVCVILSLSWFSLLNKKKYDVVDVVVTYILLGGALALDLSAILMLVLSDWYIIISSRLFELNQWQRHVLTFLLKLFRWGRFPSSDRWSRTICSYNLLHRCFKDPPQIVKKVGLKIIKDILIGFFYVDCTTENENKIVKFVVNELKSKADRVGDEDLKAIKDVCSSRGNLILEEEYCLMSDYLQPWTTDVDYDESLLTWHIATDICYYTGEADLSKETDESKDIGKSLSDYMAYLLLRQQTLVSSVVGMSDKRFADTCAEARKFETNKKLDSWSTNLWTMVKYRYYKVTSRGSGVYNMYNRASPKEKQTEFTKNFCKRLLEVNVDVRPIVAKGDKSKSVLFEACRLARQLQLLEAEAQWTVISKVWLELMCYAAVRCSPRSHVAQLNKGGELITLVWLLMAHLGFGDRFLQNQGFGWTKLIITK